MAAALPSAPAPEAPAAIQAPAPEEAPAQDQGPPPASTRDALNTLTVNVQFHSIPFTVKDSKGRIVPGLTYRDVQVFENGLLQHVSAFTTDPAPLSVALVIDQSLTTDTMEKINDSLAALQGAFSPYDEVAVFTYNNGVKRQTTFTRRRARGWVRCWNSRRARDATR